MKLGCCSWSYHRAMEAKRINFQDWLRICADELGVGGVDIIAEQMPTRTKAAYLETKKRCTDLQLTIASLSPSTSYGQPTAKARRQQVDLTRRWLDVALLMGAPCLRVFAGWPPKDQRQRLWAPMVACFRALAKPAAQAGITIVIEPHNDGGFLADSRTTLKLIRELNSPWVRINLDTGNYHDADLYAAIEASLPYAPHVVAKINKVGPDGAELTMEYGKIFSILKRHAYRGFVTVEYEGQEDELAFVPKTIAMLRRHARQAGL